MTGGDAASPWLRSRTRRVLDVLLATVALVLLSPVLLVVAVMVLGSLGRPMLFRHPRAGLGGAPFTLVKFRSMLPEVGPDGRLRADEERITRVGRLIRATSLDELPELWCVIRGDMSLVGPRPLLLEYNERYSPEQAVRLAARPGLTGLAQVSGRNGLTWTERFRLDAEHVRTATARTDLVIMLRTVGALLSRDGVYTPEGRTPDKFLGDEPEEGFSPAS